MICVEGTIYPFIEGDSLPPHARAAIDTFHAAGLEVHVGVLSNMAIGEPDVVLGTLLPAEIASLAKGPPASSKGEVRRDARRSPRPALPGLARGCGRDNRGILRDDASGQDDLARAPDTRRELR